MVWRRTNSYSIFIALLSVNPLLAQQPQATSVFPLGGRPGTALEVKIRGQNLEGTHALWFDCQGLKGEVQKVEGVVQTGEKASVAGAEKKEDRSPLQVFVKVTVDQSARLGAHAFRLISGRGVSNSLLFNVNPEPEIYEAAATLDSVSSGQRVTIPVVINGTIARKGELDRYSFEVGEDQQLLFEVISEWPRGKVPWLALYKPRGSWFDPQRLILTGANSRSVAHSPRLVRRFSRSGRYVVEVGALHSGYAATSSAGGAEYSYQLRIVPAPNLKIEERKEPVCSTVHPETHVWKERDFARHLHPDRLQELRGRTVVAAVQKKDGEVGSGAYGTNEAHDLCESKETIKLLVPVSVENEPNDSTAQALGVEVPVVIEGTISPPGDIDYFKFNIRPGQKLAFEVETPESRPLQFNPRLGLSHSEEPKVEVLSNLYKEIGGGGNAWTKSFEPKVISVFEKGGEYFLQVREFTSRHGSPECVYRLLIRTQLPHVGETWIKEDHLNLVSGEVRKLTVVSELEEGFTGELAVTVKNLPPGVQVLPAAEIRRPSPPPLGGLNRERFRPQTGTVTVVLLAEVEAPVSRVPQLTEVEVRPIVEGKPGAPIPVKGIPVMVVKSPD